MPKKPDSQIRRPPTDVIFDRHLPRVNGKCRWCGEPVDEKTWFGGKRLLWHAVCHLEFMIIIRPEMARREVEKRDHGICVDCGEDFTERYRFVRERDAWVNENNAGNWYTGSHRDERVDGYYQWVLVRLVSMWHVDHKTPLWKVAHLPPEKRIEYFKLANIITRCDECHKVKSRGETSERSHLDRLADVDLEEAPRSRWGSRKIPTRPFDRRHRPLRPK